MAVLAKKSDGASRALRLDPYQSTHHLEAAGARFRLDHKGVVVRKQLNCGLHVSMAVPARAYRGVAGRAIEDDKGNITVSLELLHHDPELCIPLLLAHDLNDVAADWHSWSRLLKLPMLVIGADGTTSAAQRMLGKLMIEDPLARRKRITTRHHRPYFLRRRKKGTVGTVERISAKELIARS